MTGGNNPDEPNGPQVLAQFLQDWTRLWQEELQARKSDPAGLPSAAYGSKPLSPDLSTAMELWRSTMGVWAQTLGAPNAPSAGSRERTAPPRPAAAAAAPDARDAEIERLARRVDELESRLTKLETPRRRRS